MSILSYTNQSDGLLIQTTHGRMALTAYTSSAIRVRYTLDAEFSPKPSLMITATPDETAPWAVRETDHSVLFSTPAVTIAIDKRTSAFTYLDSAGALLTKEPDRGGKTLDPVDVLVSVFDDAAVTEADDNPDGVRVRAQNVRQVVDRKAFHTKLEFEWAPDEAIYGLGSHEDGMLNLRGQHQYLYQQNMKAVVPVLVSTRGYGIIWDSYSLMTFHDDAFGSYLWTDVDDELDYYFILGPEMDQIVQQVRRLTGAAPMLPKWSFGYLQSKERYTSQAELIQVVQEYRARKLPLDCIVLDWKSWTGELWGQKTLDPVRFPDPDQMMADIHALHAHLMISIWPTMRAGGEDWTELRDHGCLLGNQATYDAFNPLGRELYWRQVNAGLFSHGIDAWWCDCTEPFEADWNGAVKPEPEVRLRINTEETKRYLDPETINAYSLLHSEGIYCGQRAVTDRKRVLNLTRSAYLGQQRYATVTWSGDVTATWETLRKQIADGLNFCVTGSPYWTTDIGGFFVADKPEYWFWSGGYDQGVDDLGYRELFVRWFQFGAFLPMFRAHGTDTPREIWRFGEPGAPMYDALVIFLNLRYRLMPYVYSLAGWTTQTAYTMLRLLAFDFKSDIRTHDIRDQFMLGPAFLVSPVTQPMYYGVNSTPLVGVARERAVYLPAGASWYDFWTDECYTGGQTIAAAAPIDRVPLFVRAGAVVPMAQPMQYVDEIPGAPLEIHVYPGADGVFVLYEDAGDNYDYERGAFTTIELRWDETQRCLIISDRSGGYPEMQVEREFQLMVHGASTPARRVSYSGTKVVIEN